MTIVAAGVRSLDLAGWLMQEETLERAVTT